MKIGPRISSLLTVAALALLVTAAARAQGPEGKRHRGGPPPGAMFDFLGVRGASEGKVVKGMPYRAEAVTEVSQSLADGNRITRRTTAAVARDSEGRTRRETSLAALGPLAPHDAPRLVFIQDPVAGASYVLEPDSPTARKLGVHHAQRQAGAGVRFEVPLPEGGPGPDMAFRKRLHEMGEGRWPHRDPRFGETTYRLAGIVRAEPEKSLFEVPGDYTVREGRPDTMKFRRAPDAPEQDQ